MTDFFGNTECLGFPVRDEAPNALEYTAAEFWVRESYRRYFLVTGGYPQTTTWALERFFTDRAVGDPVLELAMEVLESDFRNQFSNAIVKKFNKMLAEGASSAAVFALLKQAGPGGPRKPDMLGISAGRTLVFDAVEVGTVRTAQSTLDELDEKLDMIESDVISQIKLRMPALSDHAARGRASLFVPVDYAVRASQYRLSPLEKIMPLPLRVDNSSGKQIIDWICYHPSTNWKTSKPRRRSPGAGPGTDGLVIYHIHRTMLPEVPASIRRAIAEELNRWRQSQGYVLELNPALAGAFALNKSAWSREAIQLFTLLGVGGLLLLMVAIGWEIGILAGAAALVDAGVSAATASTASFLATLRGASTLASQLWPLAVSATPLLPAGRLAN